jgi:hypothetical protein
VKWPSLRRARIRKFGHAQHAVKINKGFVTAPCAYRVCNLQLVSQKDGRGSVERTSLVPGGGKTYGTRAGGEGWCSGIDMRAGGGRQEKRCEGSDWVHGIRPLYITGPMCSQETGISLARNRRAYAKVTFISSTGCLRLTRSRIAIPTRVYTKDDYGYDTEK